MTTQRGSRSLLLFIKYLYHVGRLQLLGYLVPGHSVYLIRTCCCPQIEDQIRGGGRADIGRFIQLAAATATTAIHV